MIDTGSTRSCNVKLKELVNAFEIVVRAQDNKKMYQPEHITWCELLLIQRPSTLGSKNLRQDVDGMLPSNARVCSSALEAEYI